MENNANTIGELEKTRHEVSLLYEISNAIHTTLKLDEILYIILTAVTAHVGLGFNRAMLFLVNEKDGFLEGKMGIGPDTGEDANKIWTHVQDAKMTLDDLISNYKVSGGLSNSQLNRFVKNLRLPLKEEEGGVLAMTLLEGMPLHIRLDNLKNPKPDTLIDSLETKEFVTTPLKAKDRVIGVLFADNLYTNKPISKDDIRILTMFANQAGMAIENSRLYEQTLIKSHTDSLTNLWNHGYFQFLLQEEINLSQRISQPLSIILTDLDNFKIYNDSLGHQEGDRLLITIANLLKASTRKQDFVCRYGGEEFAVLLPQTDKRQAYQIAEGLRQVIEKYDFPHKEVFSAGHLTISMGISAFPEDGNSNTTLVNYADKALYDAKRQGKNRICG